jgi:hypothetical protein
MKLIMRTKKYYLRFIYFCAALAIMLLIKIIIYNEGDYFDIFTIALMIFEIWLFSKKYQRMKRNDENFTLELSPREWSYEEMLDINAYIKKQESILTNKEKEVKRTYSFVWEEIEPEEIIEVQPEVDTEVKKDVMKNNLVEIKQILEDKKFAKEVWEKFGKKYKRSHASNMKKNYTATMNKIVVAKKENSLEFEDFKNNI